MTVIDTLIDKVEQLEESLPMIILNVVKEEQDFVISLNVDSQLMRGFDGEGKKVTPKYKPATVKLKKKKGQPHDRVTLRDEGDFQGSFYLEFENGQFWVKTTDHKQVWLLKRYGEQVLGLNEESLQLLINHIRETVTTKAQKMIF